MKRLTEKGDRLGSYYTYKSDNEFTTKEYDKHTEKVYNKLGKLEDLEEKLGCPLEVLSSIYNNGFYVDILDYIPPRRIYRIDIFRKEIIFYDEEEEDYFKVKLCNYKKTWWLKPDRSE